MNLNYLIKNFGLDKINSMTKYPSILTYHELGAKGMLLEKNTEDKSFEGETCYVTEKIDGTNSRIILYDGDYIIGSREEFLYAKNDRIINPAMDIVNTIKGFADILAGQADFGGDNLFVFFGESYGGKITANSKQYTASKKTAFRLFDIMRISLADLQKLLKKPIAQISLWRENQNQEYFSVQELIEISENLGIEKVPYIEEISGGKIPKSLADTFSWLNQFAKTNAGIDFSGRAEGVVVRTADRSLIRKIRFEDYNRTKAKGGF